LSPVALSPTLRHNTTTRRTMRIWIRARDYH